MQIRMKKTVEFDVGKNTRMVYGPPGRVWNVLDFAAESMIETGDAEPVEETKKKKGGK